VGLIAENQSMKAEVQAASTRWLILKEAFRTGTPNSGRRGGGAKRGGEKKVAAMGVKVGSCGELRAVSCKGEGRERGNFLRSRLGKKA